MKLIFNDATDMPIQSYEKIGGAVRVGLQYMCYN
ncbi:Uncharacterised protein [[Ruminococcus] torques]|uniref:Uncharacterized protein n=1 Tax=[Ruminococcus] torques TaxID=33039 RepID=A0A174B6J5_9FIRM|nr:Uncharacterised protein [[Ruminococcus] torques]